jgi:hypothetical protein
MQIPRCRNGNVLAFLNYQPSLKWADENTPKWVQHIALKVADRQALIDAKASRSQWHRGLGHYQSWYFPLNLFL